MNKKNKILLTQDVNLITDQTKATSTDEIISMANNPVFDLILTQINDQYYLMHTHDYQHLKTPIEASLVPQITKNGKLDFDLLLLNMTNTFKTYDLNQFNLNLSDKVLDIQITNKITFKIQTKIIQTYNTALYLDYNEDLYYANSYQFYLNVHFFYTQLKNKLLKEFNIFKTFYFNYYLNTKYKIYHLDKMYQLQTFTATGITQEFYVHFNGLYSIDNAPLIAETSFCINDYDMFVYDVKTKTYLIRTIKQLANNDIKKWKQKELIDPDLSFFKDLAIKFKGQVYYFDQLNLTVSVPIKQTMSSAIIFFIDEFDFNPTYNQFYTLFRTLIQDDPSIRVFKDLDLDFLSSALFAFIQHIGVTDHTDMSYIINNAKQWILNHK